MADVIEMPKLSDTMQTGTLVAWLKNEGDKVAVGDMIAEVETDKATMEVESFAEGVLLKQYVKTGESVAVGAPLVAIGESGETAPELNVPAAAPASKAEQAQPAAETMAPAIPSATPTAETLQQQDSNQRVKASPVARKVAEEKGVSLTGIQGTGPGGRIVKKDILEAAASGHAAAPALGSAAVTGDLSQITETRQEPVSNMRGAIARRLVESKTTIPHFYLEVDVDSAPLARMRKALNAQLAELGPQQGGAKFSVNDLILKASVEALRRVPAVNASWQGGHIQHNGSVHLAFGVAIAEGLVTPVIRDAQLKSLRQISAEAKTLIGKARDKKLKPEEMSGSTFTVTNLGMYGIRSFYGIINPPNAGILSVGAPVRQAVVSDAGEVVPGERMTLGFSGDHRVVDGATGALFLSALKRILETPETLLV